MKEPLSMTCPDLRATPCWANLFVSHAIPLAGWFRTAAVTPDSSIWPFRKHSAETHRISTSKGHIPSTTPRGKISILYLRRQNIITLFVSFHQNGRDIFWPIRTAHTQKSLFCNTESHLILNFPKISYQFYSIGTLLRSLSIHK